MSYRIMQRTIQAELIFDTNYYLGTYWDNSKYRYWVWRFEWGNKWKYLAPYISKEDITKLINKKDCLITFK